MIESAFLLQGSCGKPGQEESLVASELDARGIPFQFYSPKKISRRTLPLTENTLVVGTVDCVHGALKQLKAPIPSSDSYPEPIQKYMHRRCWKSTLGKERDRYSFGTPQPVFIKPSGREKCFTGLVVESEWDFHRIGGVSSQEPVYCSEVVEWVSEYRVYVVEGEIRSVDHYAGDGDQKLDLSVVEDALTTLAEGERALAGFGIDFGLLSTGETALVEMNDGFALGAYAISARDYTDLLIARWESRESNAG